MNNIILAAKCAENAHTGQFRKYTNEPYIYHPMRVAGMVTISYIADEDTISAAWLHDVIEDCGVTYEEIYESPYFGKQVADLVKWLTNPSKGSLLPRHERKKMDREHIQHAPFQAQYIKLCDRLDNLKDLKSCPDKGFIKLYTAETELLIEPIDVCKNLKTAIFDEIIRLRS